MTTATTRPRLTEAQRLTLGLITDTWRAYDYASSRHGMAARIFRGDVIDALVAKGYLRRERRKSPVTGLRETRLFVVDQIDGAESTRGQGWPAAKGGDATGPASAPVPIVAQPSAPSNQ